MKRIIQILIARDGLTKSEAIEQVEEFNQTFNKLLESQASLCELEQAFQDHFQLEPDYLDAFLLKSIKRAAPLFIY